MHHFLMFFSLFVLTSTKPLFAQTTLNQLKLHPVRPATKWGGETGHGWGHKMQIVDARGTVEPRSTFLCESWQLKSQPQCCKAGATFSCRNLSEAFYMTCTRSAKGEAYVITPSFTTRTSEPLPRPLWLYGYINAAAKCSEFSEQEKKIHKAWGKIRVENLIGTKAVAHTIVLPPWNVVWPAYQR